MLKMVALPQARAMTTDRVNANTRVRRSNKKWQHSSSSSSSSESKGELCVAHVSSNPYAVPHYYNLQGYPIHFNAGQSGNIQSVTLNTSHMHGMHFQNTQTPNFANMYYLQTQFPVPLQLPIHSYQAGDTMTKF